MALGKGDIRTLTLNKIKAKKNWSEFQLLGMIR